MNTFWAIKKLVPTVACILSPRRFDIQLCALLGMPLDAPHSIEKMRLFVKEQQNWTSIKQ